MSENKALSVFMTGANGGMGKAVTRLLCQKEVASIVMAARDANKAALARDELLKMQALGSHISTQLIAAKGDFDMNAPDKIEAAIKALPDDIQFDVVFLQAGGVVFSKDYETVKWNGHVIEKTIFQNVIGAHITLFFLKKYQKLAPNVRVVYAGGEGARGIPGMIKVPSFTSANALREYIFNKSNTEQYHPMNAIGVSKFMGALWTMALAKKEANMEVIWFSPGLTYGTDGLMDLPIVKRWVMENIMFKLMQLLGKAQSPQQGAQKFVDCLLGKVGKNGEVIGAPKGKTLGALMDQIPMNPALNDLALQNEFWSILKEVEGEN
ncbi:NAD-dependent epimerase/dehydratase family protein [uncultured Shewanella sp.]|uniref:NAD-dependent epimerase/dehydratase family protein n=1 Tax=uncultured Shewanella sp. TaxID=173975 RepID=UPI0026133259|nr:NAD-dependent epimerase/dehydratase family protein [uncultured Shewanella sp.]